uniref:Uncharacterized protein n=1 Tax=Rhizophora mucronata TaxID=61149 RepID=A0A2P2PBX4_RHIMU
MAEETNKYVTACLSLFYAKFFSCFLFSCFMCYSLSVTGMSLNF